MSGKVFTGELPEADSVDDIIGNATVDGRARTVRIAVSNLIAQMGIIGQEDMETDADETIVVSQNAPYIRHSATLTDDRVITLSTTNAYRGARFLVTRTGSGAFNLSIGGLTDLSQGEWAEVIFNGTSWYLSSRGSL
jgi:hypothetical protein